MRVTIPPEASGQTLADYLRSRSYFLSQPCGGNGTCGKCRVKTEDGTELLACRTLCPPEGITVTFDDMRVDEAEPYTLSSGRRGIALDVGTTTLALAAVELPSCRILATRAALNPQAAFGADVITRIGQSAAHGKEMQTVLLDAIRTLGEGFFPAEEMVVAGNPTMLALFAGVSPEPMGRAPFTPAFIDRLTLRGDALALPVGTVHLLPGASAFVGADVLAGIARTKMLSADAPSLLLDLGTNGEMALYVPERGTLTVTSAAAGPALEGANVSCGIGGVSGAVCRVDSRNGRFTYETVDDAPARGLCGSGLIDLVACLLDEALLDETGALTKAPFVLKGVHKTKHGDVPDQAPVLTLTQGDIRELQLAKSAVRAGLEVLLRDATLTVRDVKHVYLAGGIGTFIRGGSAARIGLLPDEFLPRFSAVGNTALAGAADALRDPTLLDGIAARAKTLTLNDAPRFAELFVENMTFPTEE